MVGGLKATQRSTEASWEGGSPQHVVMQLFLALVVPVVLLVGLTALLATGRLALSRNATWLLARQNTIWMAGIVALAAAAVVVAMQR